MRPAEFDWEMNHISDRCVLILFGIDLVVLVFVIKYGKHFLIYDVFPIVLAVIVIFHLLYSSNGFCGCLIYFNWPWPISLVLGYWICHGARRVVISYEYLKRPFINMLNVIYLTGFLSIYLSFYFLSPDNSNVLLFPLLKCFMEVCQKKY